MKTEPNIRILINTIGAPLLSPRGDVRISSLQNGTVRYTVADSRSAIAVENLLIGKDFHWQQPASALFHGDFSVERDKTGKFRAFNIIPIEEYLKCVVGSEMNPLAPQEFIRAHAVISRSWALHKLQKRQKTRDNCGKEIGDNIIRDWEEADDHTGFDFCNDDHCQRYQGIPEQFSPASEAVEATRGIVLTDASGNIADTRYSKCCGGKTELFSTCWTDEDPDYLRSVADPWCDLTSLPHISREQFLSRILKNYDLSTTGFHTWTCSISAKEIARNLKNKFRRDLGEILDIEPVEKGASGRIKSLKIIGTKGELVIGKELMVRKLLSSTHLYSSLFEIERISAISAEEPNPKELIFRLNGKGWGHGVGLCQIGAAHMAAEGKNWREILQFYYLGAKITKIYD